MGNLLNKKERTFLEEVKYMYSSASYLDKYGHHFMISIATVLLFFIVFSYFYILSKKAPIKDNWDNEKCKPNVIPFAGLIMEPENMTQFQFTADNFSGCLNEVLASIVSGFTDPLYKTTNTLTNLFDAVKKMLNMVRNMMDYIRTKFGSIFTGLLNQISGILLPINIVVIRLKRIMGKIQGVIATSFFTVASIWLSLKSAMGAFVDVMIAALSISAAAVVVLGVIAAFFHAWIPVAVGAFAVWIVPAIVFTVITIWLSSIFETHAFSVSDTELGCFDENTLLQLKDGTFIKIKDVNVGDKLKNGSYITSKFIVNAKNIQMYNVDNIIVSNSHYIKNKNNDWVKVENYNKAVKIDNYNKELIYCINTSNKRISIENHIFLDWDDFMDIDLLKLKNNKHLKKNDTMKNIHKNLEGGLDENTMLELESGHVVSIKDIEVNDVLKYGEIVFAKVEIFGDNLENIKHINYNNVTLTGVNILIKSDLGVKHSRNISGSLKKRNKLYHLITNKGSFYVNGLTILDYDSNLVEILDIHENKEKNMCI